MKIGAIGIRTKIIVGDAATWYLVKKYIDGKLVGWIEDVPEELKKYVRVLDSWVDVTEDLESIENKVDKEDGKSLIADTEIDKLAGIEENANDYTHPLIHHVSILDVVDVDGGSANKFLNERGEMKQPTHANLTDKNSEAAFQHVDERINEIPASAGVATYTLLNRRQNLITGTLPNGVNSALVLPTIISGERNEVILHFKTNAVAAPTFVYSGFMPVWGDNVPIGMKVNKQYTIVFQNVNGIVKTDWREY